MDITFNIEKFEAGIIITIHGREYEIDLQSLDRQFIEIEIDPDELDLNQIDEDTIKNHLEGIHGPIYMECQETEMIEHLESCYGEIFREGEEDEMIEHLENEGYFIANSIDEAVKRVKDWLKFNNEDEDAEEKFIEDGKWVVDPDEIDEVDTFEFVSEALNRKGYYILKIPSFLRGLLGGSK